MRDERFKLQRGDDENDRRLARMLERMQRAGWIDYIVEKQNVVAPHFTVLGKQRIREIVRVEQELQDYFGVLTVEELANVFSTAEAFLPDAEAQTD